MDALTDAKQIADAEVTAVTGVRVLLVAPSPPPYGGMAIQARQLERRLKNDGASVVFFPSNLPFPAWLKPVDRVPMLRTITRTVMIWFKLWRQVGQADVVHVLAASWVYFFAVVCPAVFYSKLRGKHVNLNYRGGDAREFFRLYRRVIGPVFNLCDSVTSPSGFLADAIRKNFEIDVAIVPNIIDDSVFRYRQRQTIRPKMLVTRHMEKIYDVESAIRAFRIVREKYPDATLWIAGSGSLESHLRGLVAEWNLSGVEFLGHVPHKELAALYDQCDILLNSSLVDNFPGALLEASAAGLVIVSTGAGGIPYMFRNEESALLVEPGDWQALGAAVERVLSEPSLAADLSRRATALARNSTWSEVSKALYRAYGLENKEAALIAR